MPAYIRESPRIPMAIQIVPLQITESAIIDIRLIVIICKIFSAVDDGLI